MGSPAFAVPSLVALVEAGYDVVAAISQPDKPAGRGSALHAPEVKEAAQARGIRTFQPPTLRDEAAQDGLAAFGADIFVVAAYGKLLPKAVLEMPRHGCINVHASLLPRWRGASPITAAILAGDVATGVTIMLLEARMDAGPIIATTARLPIGPGETTGSLEPKLAAAGAELLAEMLPGWLAGDLRATQQDEALVTTSSLIKKEDGHLRAGMTVEEAERAVRAYNPWPGAYVDYRSQRLGIWAAHVVPGTSGAPGTFRIEQK
ncbi:MAG: methionyl-tRNA formyltransferase, partial [Tepidiformaceae bacterium]